MKRPTTLFSEFYRNPRNALSLTLILLLLAAPSFAQSFRYAQELSDAFNHTAKVITPSVVSISASKKPSNQMGRSLRRLPEGFKDFFGDDFLERFAPPGSDGSLQQGMGTGVIVDSGGYILTNNHVVGEADEVKVRLHDKRTFDASIVGTDPRTDLAVIKVDADGLIPAKLGSSEKLRIGEWVVAAGNPFGLDNTITQGIVSAKGRSIMGGNMYEDFIQTDAAINPGNSGGPLVNLRGEVIGINTAIFSRSGGYMGIGFAIPIDMAKGVMNSLINDGRVIRGWLGVGIQNLTKELAESFNHPSTDGALVGHVQEDAPALDAGIQQGDIIIRFASAVVKDVNQLRNAVAQTRPGKEVELDVIRDGRKKRLMVRIGELPSGDEKPETLLEEDEAPDLGITVEPMTEEIARKLRVNREYGLLITSVRPGSLAQKAGLSQRDIILRAGGEKIKSVRDLKDAVSKEKLRKGVRIIVETQGMERFVFLRSE